MSAADSRGAVSRSTSPATPTTTTPGPGRATGSRNRLSVDATGVRPSVASPATAVRLHPARKTPDAAADSTGVPTTSASPAYCSHQATTPANTNYAAVTISYS